MERTLILGIGNILLADEGVGIHVARLLGSRPLPPDIAILDGGTSGYELLGHIAGRSRVVIVDCIRSNEKAGSVLLTTIKDLRQQRQEPWTAHDHGATELLHGITALVPAPEVVILGIVPESPFEMRIGLSETLQDKLASYADLALAVAISPEFRLSTSHRMHLPDDLGGVT